MEFSYQSTKSIKDVFFSKNLGYKTLVSQTQTKEKQRKRTRLNGHLRDAFKSHYESEASCVVFIMKIGFHSLHEVFILQAFYLDSLS